MSFYELTWANGSKSVMNLLVGDIHEEIAKMPPDDRGEVVSYREVPQPEPRPPQQFQPSVSSVSGDHSAEIAELRQLLLMTAETVAQQAATHAQDLANARAESQRNLEILMQSLERGIKDAASKGGAA